MNTRLAPLLSDQPAPVVIIHRPGFVSGPLQHRPVAGYTYDILCYDGRMYQGVRFRDEGAHPPGFYVLDYRYASLGETFQYELIRT